MTEVTTEKKFIQPTKGDGPQTSLHLTVPHTVLQDSNPDLLNPNLQGVSTRIYIFKKSLRDPEAMGIWPLLAVIPEGLEQRY